MQQAIADPGIRPTGHLQRKQQAICNESNRPFATKATGQLQRFRQGIRNSDLMDRLRIGYRASRQPSRLRSLLLAGGKAERLRYRAIQFSNGVRSTVSSSGLSRSMRA